MVCSDTLLISCGFHLSGSSYDTKLGIVSDCPEGLDFCFYNDDYDGLASGFDCMAFEAATTYYIIIAGFQEATGDYTLNVDQCIL